MNKISIKNHKGKDAGPDLRARTNLAFMHISFIRLFVFCIFLLMLFPLKANLLKDLKDGEAFQLPGSSLSSVLVDQNNDDIIDGIDFDLDGSGELAIIDIGRDNAIGIDDNLDKEVDFYIVQSKTGELIIAISLEEEAKITSDSAQFALKRVTVWNELSITVVGVFGTSIGSFSNALPYVFGGSLYIEQGLDSLLSTITDLKRVFWLPGIRLTGGYDFYTSGSTQTTISLVNLQLGPVWRIPVHSKHDGYFIISSTFGIANLSIELNRGITQGLSFSTDLALGYEYPFFGVKIGVQGIGRYVLSSVAVFLQVSGSLSVGYNISL